jgi:uncharacterized membrane protein
VIRAHVRRFLEWGTINMRPIWRFIRATFLGGVLFLIPLVLVALVVREALRLASRLVAPMAEMLPAERIGGVIVADGVAVVALLALCFLAGLLVGTRPGHAMAQRLERMVLRKMPGFSLIKSASHSLAGLKEGGDIQPALARIEDAWALAFVVERHSSGLLTVFVPSAPTPAAGSIYYLTSDRVQLLDVPVPVAVGCVMTLGVGSNALLDAAGQLLPNGRTAGIEPANLLEGSREM